VGGARKLPARLEAGLYRIAQEALGNALRHAGAREITVQLVTAPERIALTVEDDGRGFEPGSNSGGGRRFGLVGLAERARLLGGALSVSSAPEAGTRVEAVVPLG
jgi:two-component system NarL family sensor kinase